MRIVALGVSCVDIYPQTGTLTPGGEALNSAVHLALRGDTDVFLMGAVGTDKYAAAILDAVRRHSINREHVHELPGESAHHVIQIAPSGDRYFEEGAWHGGVSGDFRFGESDRALLQTADGVITTLWENNLRELITLRQEHGLLVAVDFNAHQDLRDWDDVAGRIDILFSGAGKAMIDDFQARSLVSGSVFVLTRGKAGSVAFHRGERFVCAAVPVNDVVDTTGCGDCYQGVFVREYLETGDIQRSMERASVAASRVTAYVGGFPG